MGAWMGVHFGENYSRFYDGKSAGVVAVTPIYFKLRIQNIHECFLK
jgi:hypothetical protein